MTADYPFLKHVSNGNARDLGPFRGSAVGKTLRKYTKNGRLIIEKDGQQYNGIGQRML